MHVHFKVHGAGKKNLHGDGIALWYTRDRLVHGRAVLRVWGPSGRGPSTLYSLVRRRLLFFREPWDLRLAEGGPLGKKRDWALQLSSVTVEACCCTPAKNGFPHFRVLFLKSRSKEVCMWPLKFKVFPLWTLAGGCRLLS